MSQSEWTAPDTSGQGSKLSNEQRARLQRLRQLERVGTKGLMFHGALIALGIAIAAALSGPKGTASFMIGGGFAIMNLAVINWITMQIAHYGVEKMGTYLAIFLIKFLVLAALLAFVLLRYKPHGGPFLLGYSTLIPIVFGTTIARGRSK